MTATTGAKQQKKEAFLVAIVHSEHDIEQIKKSRVVKASISSCDLKNHFEHKINKNIYTKTISNTKSIHNIY